MTFSGVNFARGTTSEWGGKGGGCILAQGSSRLSVQDGRFDSCFAKGLSAPGGAVAIEEASHATLSSVVITNSGAYRGGGVAVYDQSTLVMTNILIKNCTSVDSIPRGGGVYMEESTASLSSVDFVACSSIILEEDHAADWALFAYSNGGGIFLYRSAANMTDVAFRGCLASRGGAISLNELSVVHMARLVLEENQNDDFYIQASE